MTSYRADQVGEQVREEIMSIIRRELKDPRIGFVSITAVRMSPDLRQARVRVSVLGKPDEQKASIRRKDSSAMSSGAGCRTSRSHRTSASSWIRRSNTASTSRSC